MSNRELAKSLIDKIPDSRLSYVILYLQGASIPDETPNAETLAAMQEAEEIGQHPERYTRYSSFAELRKEVLGDA